MIEINWLEHTALVNEAIAEKQRKQECQWMMETNWLEHVAKKKAQLDTNTVNQLEHVAKKKAQLTANVVHQCEHIMREKVQMTRNEVNPLEHIVKKEQVWLQMKQNIFKNNKLVLYRMFQEMKQFICNKWPTSIKIAGQLNMKD